MQFTPYHHRTGRASTLTCSSLRRAMATLPDSLLLHWECRRVSEDLIACLLWRCLVSYGHTNPGQSKSRPARLVASSSRRPTTASEMGHEQEEAGKKKAAHARDPRLFLFQIGGQPAPWNLADRSISVCMHVDPPIMIPTAIHPSTALDRYALRSTKHFPRTSQIPSSRRHTTTAAAQ